MLVEHRNRDVDAIGQQFLRNAAIDLRLDRPPAERMRAVTRRTLARVRVEDGVASADVPVVRAAVRVDARPVQFLQVPTDRVRRRPPVPRREQRFPTESIGHVVPVGIIHVVADQLRQVGRNIHVPFPLAPVFQRSTLLLRVISLRSIAEPDHPVFEVEVADIDRSDRPDASALPSLMHRQFRRFLVG